MLQLKSHRVKLSEIKVDRIKRQRQHDRGEDGLVDVESDGFLEDVKRRGVISPVLVDGGMNLIYGERRYTASLIAGFEDIPVIFVEELTELQAEALELVENVRRKNLHWIDETRAVDRFHRLCLRENATWTKSDSARELGYDYARVQVFLRVAEDLVEEKIQKCANVREAYNLLTRRDDRAQADLINEITEVGNELFEREDGQLAVQQRQQLTPPFTIAPGGSPPVSLPGAGGGDRVEIRQSGQAVSPQSPPLLKPRRLCDVKAEESIVCKDFKEWIEEYSGPKFNFVHCDFPYGTNLFGGPQSGRARHETIYEDEKDVYWKLVEVFCCNVDKFMAQSAHLMFWLKNDIEVMTKTIARFRDLAPSLVFNTTPLIWHKTDNVGVLSDPKRGPRNIYETALIASRDDRLIVKATSNAYGCQTDKTLHVSTKPEPMLRQFMGMFVDSNSKVLDPTCGSGSALRAAESLGAQTVLGLERHPEFHKAAVGALQTFRNKRKMES